MTAPDPDLAEQQARDTAALARAIVAGLCPDCGGIGWQFCGLVDGVPDEGPCRKCGGEQP